MSRPLPLASPSLPFITRLRSLPLPAPAGRWAQVTVNAAPTSKLAAETPRCQPLVTDSILAGSGRRQCRFLLAASPERVHARALSWKWLWPIHVVETPKAFPRPGFCRQGPVSPSWQSSKNQEDEARAGKKKKKKPPPEYPSGAPHYGSLLEGHTLFTVVNRKPEAQRGVGQCVRQPSIGRAQSERSDSIIPPCFPSLKPYHGWREACRPDIFVHLISPTAVF